MSNAADILAKLHVTFYFKHQSAAKIRWSEIFQINNESQRINSCSKIFTSPYSLCARGIIRGGGGGMRSRSRKSEAPS